MVMSKGRVKIQDVKCQMNNMIALCLHSRVRMCVASMGVLRECPHVHLVVGVGLCSSGVVDVESNCVHNLRCGTPKSLHYKYLDW